jgi:hypothetical protein
MSNRKPLWEVMQEAHLRDVGTFEDELGNEYQGTADRETYAAIARAIADEVAPESEVPSDHEISTYGLHIAWVRWAAMYSFRQRLLDAADEAEGRS